MAKAFIGISAGILLFALPLLSHAASLIFSQTANSCAVGATCVATVRISADQYINAASGVISFPSDKLEVRSISKSPSIFNLWAQEPSFSNERGTVAFEGVILNPGFQGSGTVLTVTFRAKAAGTAGLSFSSGQILANDGAGTNVLTSLGTSLFTINSAPLPAEPTPAPQQAPEAEDLEEPLVVEYDEAPQPEEPKNAPLVISAEALRVVAIIAPLALLVLALLWLVLYLRKHTIRRTRSVGKEVHEAESVLHEVFDQLREDLADSVRHLEKAKSTRDLTREEDRILKRFKKSLDTAERTIKKEIHDIEK